MICKKCGLKKYDPHYKSVAVKLATDFLNDYKSIEEKLLNKLVGKMHPLDEEHTKKVQVFVKLLNKCKMDITKGVGNLR